MNRNLYTMKQNIGKQIGDTTSAMLSIITTFLNNRLMEVYRRSNILDSSKTDYSLTTTAGTEDYLLPYDFGKEISVVDKTNKISLGRIDSQANTVLNTDELDNQGSVSKYIILDKTVITQPSAAAVVTFVSSSASDSSQVVYVKGLDANGYEAYEAETLTGTTPVSTTTQFTKILLISKSAATAGTVTVTSSTTTLAVLSMEMLEHRVKVIRFVNIPNAALTIELNYLQKLLPMSQDYDYPILDCADIIEAGAEADAWRFKRQFSKAADMDIVFEKRLANLLFDNENQPNKVNVFRPRTYSHYDNTGNVNDYRYGVF